MAQLAPSSQHQVPPFRRGLQKLYDAMAAIGTVWIFGLMLLIMADVLGRNLLAHPVTGVAEIAARSVVAIVFLMLPASALRGAMIRADFLVSRVRRFAPGLVKALDAGFALVGAAIFFCIAWSAWPDTAVAWARGEFFGVQGVWTLPTLPFRLIIVISGVATGFGLLVALVQPATGPDEMVEF